MGLCDIGGGGGGDQQVTQTTAPPEWTQPYWQDLVGQGANLASQPYQQYDGMTVSPWNGTQDAAAGLTAETALGGSPDANAARASNMAISNGGYLGNPYATDSYVNQQISNTAGDMANAYATGTAADQARNAQMAGAFGGGGDKAMQLAGAKGLEQQVGNMANQYRMQNAQAGMGDYRSGVGQMLGANSQGLGYQQADMANSNQLMNVGNLQNSYVQALLNQGSQNFQNQQNWPKEQLGLLQSILGSASGNYGSQVSTQNGGGTNWVNAGVGGLAGLAGLFGGK